MPHNLVNLMFVSNLQIGTTNLLFMRQAATLLQLILSRNEIGLIQQTTPT
jgi:hypothetical protein